MRLAGGDSREIASAQAHMIAVEFAEEEGEVEVGETARRQRW
jgi:hypothetical protein